MIKKQLLQAVTDAIISAAKYFAVKMDIGLTEPEIIINSMDNFIEGKLEHYINSYNDNLELKTDTSIKIMGFAYANTFAEIEESIPYKNIRI